MIGISRVVADRQTERQTDTHDLSHDGHQQSGRGGVAGDLRGAGDDQTEDQVQYPRFKR